MFSVDFWNLNRPIDQWKILHSAFVLTKFSLFESLQIGGWSGIQPKETCWDVSCSSVCLYVSLSVCMSVGGRRGGGHTDYFVTQFLPTVGLRLILGVLGSQRWRVVCAAARGIYRSTSSWVYERFWWVGNPICVIRINEKDERMKKIIKNGDRLASFIRNVMPVKFLRHVIEQLNSLRSCCMV